MGGCSGGCRGRKGRGSGQHLVMGGGGSHAAPGEAAHPGSYAHISPRISPGVGVHDRQVSGRRQEKKRLRYTRKHARAHAGSRNTTAWSLYPLAGRRHCQYLASSALFTLLHTSLYCSLLLLTLQSLFFFPGKKIISLFDQHTPIVSQNCLSNASRILFFSLSRKITHMSFPYKEKKNTMNSLSTFFPPPKSTTPSSFL